jgi:transcription antitermination factor NusA-like protein
VPPASKADSVQTTEFEIPREFVKHLVGANGVAAKRLRDLLGIKIDFVDEAEDKDASKKKKASEGTQKTSVKVNMITRPLSSPLPPPID